MLYQPLVDSSDAPRPSEAAVAAGDDSPAAMFGWWDAKPDLERWLTSFYQYFEMKGYKGFVATQLVHLAAVAFTIVFSFWLFFFVNWEAVMACHSEESCRESSLLYDSPFEEIGIGRTVMMFCFILLFAYWLACVVSAAHTLRDAAEMSQYYKERLGIVSDDMLGTMVWSEVVSRLVQVQRTHPFCIVQDGLSALEIANIIMREDNFIIALTNHGALASHLPWWIPARLAYTRAVLACVRPLIFRWAFDSRGRFRQDFLENPVNLGKRFRVLGLVTLPLAVPVSFFVTLVLFMRRAEEFRSHRTAPFRREWTDYAKWTFREFNEFPHHFKERMRSAQMAAEEYASCTRPSTPVFDTFQRFVKFIAGSILAVILIVALRDDDPLLYVKVQGKNLVWYLAIFGFLFTIAHNNDEDASGRPLPQAPAAGFTGAPLLMHLAMMRLVRCTHHYPTAWRAPAPLSALAGSCSGIQRWRLRQHFETIRSEFLNVFFVHRIRALCEELLGVLLAPLLLIVYLPEAAPEIIDVFRRSRYSSPNLGDWCVFGCLDPVESGSELYSGPAWRLHHGDGGSSSAREPHGAAVEPMQSMHSGDLGPELRPHCKGGKVEKSVLSFILNHRLRWTSCSGTFDNDSDFAISHDFSVGAAGCRKDGPGQSVRTFGREITGGDRPSFPMKDFGATPKGADEPEPVEPPRQHDAADETARAEVWGYPACALSLLHELEEFQQREAGGPTPQRNIYKLFPEELLRLERAAPAPGGAVVAPASATGAGPPDGQAAQGSCSSHFFWLEVLYDFYSGRHASQLGEAGGGATFELLTGSDEHEEDLANNP